MKNKLTALLIASLSSAALAEGDNNGRTSGRAGSAYSTGDFIDGALLNPSLAANFKDEDDFALNLNFGVFATDPDELVENGEDLVDLLDQYDNGRELSINDADKISQLLTDISGANAYVSGGGNIAFAIPNNTVAATVFVRSNVNASVVPLVDPNDFATLTNQTGGQFDSDDLNSSVAVRGSMVTEIGIALAKKFNFTQSGEWLVGVTPKQVEAETFFYVDTVSDFDEDNIEEDEQTISETFFTMDAGVTYLNGNMRYAMVVNNLIGQDIDSVALGEDLSIEPQAIASVGYSLEWVNLDAAVELNSAKNYALVDETQIARVGVEFGSHTWARLRLGYKTDIQSSLEDTYTLGLGLAPFDAVNLDLTLMAGDKNTYGTSLQLGFRF
ncbi:conjugal transfer protein TraF [Gilvimarinus xylanilyticus]|uniref:Conjugal transfer protein TraF n=1 Tax=Gilvimarinus xylanilyticus TaxID=2944139 RepID=A0A9X2I0P6_9GAMM|nr:conjugal transfer protein TraF [Gilvimarinus xylanilyticus]MCP8898056.1 conjugal transfer protein TraF [Gilvimarinus xylanilyticus]